MHGTAIDPALEWQYLTGQFRPTFPALLAEFEKLNAAAVAASDCELDLRYGPAERQTFDWFPAHGACVGTLLYFHAGYWHSRDKSGFRFLAPAFNARGLNVALVNYPLCPGVSLAELVQACRAAPAAIAAHAAHAASRCAGPLATRLVVAGHSAGAHIAVELALGAAAVTDAAASLPAAISITAVAAFSGIYELMPLLATSLNEKLRLDRASAAAASPLHRSIPGATPALFAVGADETPAFIEQSRRMHAAWRSAGHGSRLEIAAGCDHFSLLRELARPSSALQQRVVELAAA